MRHLGIAFACVGIMAVGCGGTSSPSTTPTTTSLTRSTPDLGAFLKLPVATPSACPSTVNGTTSGRRSPWVGTVDVSVFLRPADTTRQILSLGNFLRRDLLVRTAYFESASQAYQEFQRLYTCSTSVPRSAAPPSYRLVLASTATLTTRNRLVERIATHSGVESVSCDPSVPCTDVAIRPTPK